MAILFNLSRSILSLLAYLLNQSSIAPTGIGVGVMVGVGVGFFVGVGIGVSVMMMMSIVGEGMISVGVTVIPSILELFCFLINAGINNMTRISIINSTGLSFMQGNYTT